MSGRRHRVLRKARHVVKDNLDRDFDSLLGVLKRQRDETLREANAAYEKGLQHLKDDRTEARQKAWKTYEDERANLLKTLAEHAKAEAA